MKAAGMRKLIFGGAIAVLAAWLIVPRLLGRGPTAAQAAPRTAGVLRGSESGPTAADAARPASARDPFITEAQPPEPPSAVTTGWPANPFFVESRAMPAASASGSAESRAPVATPGRQDTFVLSAILTGAVPRALVNGAIVSVGDVVTGETRVSSIDAYAVTLQGPQGPIVLKLAD